MKRWFWELIGAVITLAVGAGIFCIGFSQLGWDYKNLDDQTYVQETYEEAVEFSKLSVSTVLDDVNISVGEKFFVSYYVSENGNDKYEISVTDGELKIEEKTEQPRWFNFFRGIGKIGLDVDITVTPEMYFELNINTVSAEINLNTLKLKNLTVTNVNGEIDINDCVIADGTISVTNGEVSCANVVANSLACSTVNGEVVFDNVLCPKIEASTVNGEISGTLIGSLDEYNVSVSTVNGAKNLTDKTVEGSDKKLNASTVNGAININFISAV